MRRILYIGQLLLAAAIIYWLVISGQLQFSSYSVLLSQQSLWLVASIALAQFVSLSIYAGRWWGLARALGLNLSLSEALMSGYRGLFLGLIVPGSLGVDGTRLLLVQQQFQGQKAKGVGSIMIDRLTGYIGLLLLGFVAAQFLALRIESQLLDGLALASVVALLIMCGLLLSALGIVNLPGQRWLMKFQRIARLQEALQVYRQHGLQLALSIGLAVITHLFTCLAWWLTIVLLERNVAADGVVAITSLLTAVRSIPITPLGLGVTDGIAEALYQLIGSSVGAEAQMLIRLISSAVLLAFGLAYFKRAR